MHRPRLRHLATCRESEGTDHDSAGWGQHSYEAYDSYITTAPTDEQGCCNQIYRCGIFGRDKQILLQIKSGYIFSQIHPQMKE